MSARVIFLTVVRSLEEKKRVRMLMDSIRAFGGALCACPIWVFETNSRKTACHDLAGNGIQVIPLQVPETVRDYIFGDKVYACAQAETMMPPETHTLVWIDSNCLVVQPPLLFDLGGTFDAAVRPVHIRNVGLVANDPLDAYWEMIYATVGVNDIASTIESFVDGQQLRAYFNSHAFAVNPRKELLNRWFDLFEKLVCDPGFQAHACADERHQVFLHQAILSALVATTFDAIRVRVLPPEYNYPLHLHSQIPLARRAQTLNRLVCPVYEEDAPHPDRLNDLRVDEPLRTWLIEHAK